MRSRGILFSYLIGAPLGLGTVLFTLMMPVMLTGEGLPLMMILGAFGSGILALVIAFLIILWPAGRKAGAELEQGRPLLGVSFRYSLRVNAVIWSAFLVLASLQQRFLQGPRDLRIDDLIDFWSLFGTTVVSIMLGLTCTVVSTLTVGLLICKLTKG